MNLDERLRAHTLPYLAALFGCCIEEAWDRPATWQTFDDGTGKDKSLARVFHGSIREWVETMESLNRSGAAICLAVNGTDLHGRQKGNVLFPRAVWADVDLKSATQEFRMECLPLRPSMLCFTGHGHHVYWLFNDQAPFTETSKVAFEHDLRRIQAFLAPFGADPKVCQVQAVLRVPGFFNRKRPPYPLVELVHADPAHVVSIDQLRDAFPGASPTGGKDQPLACSQAPASVDQNFAKARAYLKKVGGVPEGERNALRFKLACFLVFNKGLSDQLAFELLREWDQSCSPPEGDAAVWESIRNARRYGKGAAPSADLPGQDSKSAVPVPQSSNQLLLDLAHANIAELFHTKDRQCFLRVRGGGSTETFPVKSPTTAEWIRGLYWRKYRQPLRDESVKAVAETLAAEAQFEGPVKEVGLRVVRQGDTVYINTCRETGEIIRVDSSGWAVLQSGDCPIPFLRAPGMSALPLPIRGGSVGDFRPFVYGSFSDFQLLTAWCIAALAVTGQYPLLGLFGESGSAKSFLTLVVRSLVDPSGVPFQGKPLSSRDLYIRASHCHCLALNNLSEMPQWLSDDLCGIALGSGFVTRELHTDSDEILIHTVNPIVVNGIPNLFRAADLADRGFPIVLDRIPAHRRIPEAELWARWHQVHPRIFGAILDLVAGGLRESKGRKLAIYPRLADVAVFLDAAEQALLGGQNAFPVITAEWGREYWRQGDLMAALLHYQRDNAAHQILDHPITMAISRLVREKPAFRGTMTDLLNAMCSVSPGGKEPGWPKRPNALSAWLSENGPALRAIGFDITRDRGGDKANPKLIHIRWDQAAHGEARPDSTSGDLAI